MTNRLGRATDRVRQLNSSVASASNEEQKNLCQQIGILYKRCQLLQFAIVFLTFSIFFVGLNVLMLFLAITLDINLQMIIMACFVASIVSLIISLSIFLYDISITLQSLRIEIGKNMK